MNQEMHHHLTAQLNSIREKLDPLRRPDSMVFLTFSDLHASSLNGQLVETLLEQLHLADRILEPDYVIDLGDNTGMLGRNQHISNEALASLLTGFFDTVASKISCPLLLVPGNHDGPGTDFFHPDFWNALTKGRYGHGPAVYDPEGAWWYLDDPKSKTRLVMLCVPSGSHVDRDIPAPIWALGDRQLQWLADQALDTPDPVILLIHVPAFDVYRKDMESMLDVWTGQRPARSYIRDLCGEIEDRELFGRILTAFQNHEAFTDEARGIFLKSSPPTALLAAAFSGHTHADSLWQPGETRGPDVNLLPCVQAVIGRPCGWEGIPAEGLSMDAVLWNPSDGSFRIFRIGEGQDRSFCV